MAIGFDDYHLILLDLFNCNFPVLGKKEEGRRKEEEGKRDKYSNKRGKS
ncbi:hypothetical protein [Dapis sp. BLCC M229]